nr:hypothetical protein KitaXyl93_21790 [Kitasatospora sp. Xyl93]
MPMSGFFMRDLSVWGVHGWGSTKAVADMTHCQESRRYQEPLKPHWPVTADARLGVRGGAEHGGAEHGDAERGLRLGAARRRGLRLGACDPCIWLGARPAAPGAARGSGSGGRRRAVNSPAGTVNRPASTPGRD